MYNSLNLLRNISFNMWLSVTETKSAILFQDKTTYFTLYKEEAENLGKK